jgi:hypothetical protein
MSDPEQIRVDLLKFRRKAYLSYPEGSWQRKTFLKTILQNELRLTKQEMPHDLINFLVEGDKVVLWDMVKQFLSWAAFSALCVIAFAFLHSYWSSFIFLFVGAGSLGVGLFYIYEYWRYRNSVSKVKKYFNDMQQYMNKISNDIKRLEGPHGF